MGHNFGASHDNARICRGVHSDGYLMAGIAPAFESVLSRKFSACSKKSIRQVQCNVMLIY
jgi:hypothetical protein